VHINELAFLPLFVAAYQSDFLRTQDFMPGAIS
jgi:hypothetical protein